MSARNATNFDSKQIGLSGKKFEKNLLRIQNVNVINDNFQNIE